MILSHQIAFKLEREKKPNLKARGASVGDNDTSSDTNTMNLLNQHSEMTHHTLIKENSFKSKPRAGHKAELIPELGTRPD